MHDTARTVRPAEPSSDFDRQAEQIAQWMELLSDPSAAVELRAPKFNQGGGRKQQTRSGFFDFDHLYDFARRSLAINRQAPGVYFTLNPVNRDLLSRRNNRDDIADSGSLAHDKDITARRWLLVDIDPIRPSDVSSTEAEKAAALALIHSVRDHLASLGWSAPLLCDSGNGFHLLYRIDLPTDDGGQVKACLRALAHKFDTPAVKVDRTVFNASRICKIYGSKSRKGDSTAERPHRQSSILEIPRPIEIVSPELIKALAATAPREPEPARAVGQSSAAKSTGGKSSGKSKSKQPVDPISRARQYLAKFPGAVSGQDGQTKTFRAACILVEGFALSVDDALPLFQEWNQTCSPPWENHELIRKLREAADAATEPGKLLGDAPWESESATARDGEGSSETAGDDVDTTGQLDLCELGTRDLLTDKLILSTSRTLPTAEAYIREHNSHERGRTIHDYADELWHWKDNRYVPVERGAIRGKLTTWLHEAVCVEESKGGEIEFEPFPANPQTVESTVRTIKAYAHLPSSFVPPVWIRSDGDQPETEPRHDPREILVSPRQLLHIPSQTPIEPTPELFTTNAIEFEPDLAAPIPELWYSFLQQLFDDDMESIDLLQEWFGYCLTGDTSQQKMLLIVGPRRSGKGTIGRILRHVIGMGNIAGPTVSALAGQFGLQPLIGKTLAIVSDARFSGDDIGIVVERLLCISGEDTLTIDRKHIGSVTMRLPTRFLFFSNELPRLSEASGALAGRFMILRLTQSFYGREDLHLERKLLAELPGILNWALQGWRQLHERGHFKQPQSVSEAVRDLEELASPTMSFIHDCCEVDSSYRCYADKLYESYTAWSKEEGRDRVPNKATFGKDLAAILPGISRRRDRYGWFYEGIRLQGTTGT